MDALSELAHRDDLVAGIEALDRMNSGHVERPTYARSKFFVNVIRV
jgi:hypothetical protein